MTTPTSTNSAPTRSAGLSDMPDWMRLGTCSEAGATGAFSAESASNETEIDISAVERAGMTGLADNQKVSYEMISGRDGRQSAGELKAI